MSKSIYEQAKRDLISLTAKFVIPSVDETEYGCIYDRCHFYNILDEQEESYLKSVEQALEQARKQEKLLKLYKELITVKDKMIHSVFFDNDLDDISKIVTDLEKQIKELEK